MPMSKDTPFIAALRRAIDELGGQLATSQATDIPQSTLSRWLNGGTRKFPFDAPAKFEQATKRKVKAAEFFG